LEIQEIAFLGIFIREEVTSSKPFLNHFPIKKTLDGLHEFHTRQIGQIARTNVVGLEISTFGIVSVAKLHGVFHKPITFKHHIVTLQQGKYLTLGVW